MTTAQITTYKRNYIDNKELEFICKTGHAPSIATLKKWGKEANARIVEMQKDIAKFS